MKLSCISTSAWKVPRTRRKQETSALTCPKFLFSTRKSTVFSARSEKSLDVTLSVNGKESLEKVGGHPTGDPLGVAVVLANIWREKGGVRAGQIVTCGSCTGLKFLKPGDVCTVRFEGLGTAEVKFTKS